ncbi:MAG: M23 family metallopeptidase [Leptospiraceae bacterium]|nr:M23 family metallopeptidase [Leptospiraceae bacterium]
MKGRLRVFIFIYLLFSQFLFSEEVLHSPVDEDFLIHPGEHFCDKIYYHSYSGRSFHTGIDYIETWKSKHIYLNPYSIQDMENILKLKTSYLPSKELFSDSEYKIYLETNLYRNGIRLLDTSIGLYPPSKDEKNYGYGRNVYSIYKGKVINLFDPQKAEKWGKTILIEHESPVGQKFVFRNSEVRSGFQKFWTLYSHLSKITVVQNQVVSGGEKIGAIGHGNGIFHTMMGGNGIKEGSHLHFEVRKRLANLFPSKALLKNRNGVESIYYDPEVFLENLVLVPTKKK